MKRFNNSKGAVLVEAAVALAIFVPIFLIFGFILLNATTQLAERGTAAAYSQSPCIIRDDGKLVDPLDPNNSVVPDWCI